VESVKNHQHILSRVTEDEVVGICQDLVRFRSVNPPGDELPVASYVAGIVAEVGFTTELVTHGPQRASLVARLRGSGEVPALIYCGHLDVMPVGTEVWRHDRFAGEVSEGKLWGRGPTEMKGGVAAMAAAARALALAKLPLGGDLVLLFIADEEVHQRWAMELAARCDLAPAQALVIGEPSYNRVSSLRRVSSGSRSPRMIRRHMAPCRTWVGMQS
jgi:succinyl-diaminopimelate desuccinylase